MHCEKFFNKNLDNHGWNTQVKDDSKLIKPLHPDGVKELERTEFPTTEDEQWALNEDFGFSYQSAIG